MQTKRFPKNVFIYLDSKNYKSINPVACLVDNVSEASALIAENDFPVGMYKFVGEVKVRGQVEFKLPGDKKWKKSPVVEREPVDDDDAD